MAGHSHQVLHLPPARCRPLRDQRPVALLRPFLRAHGSRDLSRTLEDLRTEADGHRGTPAEVVLWEVMGKLCLSAERPEQATEVLGRALEEVGEGRLLRERLTALLGEAQGIVEARRRGG